MTKRYDAKLGVNMDSDFTTHRARCARCKDFDDKPSSLAGLCLEGSLLWKQANQGGG